MDVTIATKMGFDDEVEGTVINILQGRSDLPIVVQLEDCDHLEYFKRDELINLTKKKKRKAKKLSEANA
jgi:hypothetical protein